MILFFQKGRGMTVFFPQCYKFRDHHRRSVGHLLAFGGFLQTRLYNNAAKIFGIIVVLCRRLEILEGKMVYTTRGKYSIYKTSRVGVFF